MAWSSVVVTCVSLATPAKATSLKTTGDEIVIAIVAVAAAVAVVLAVVIMHESKKDRMITGCVRSAENGMTIADERSQQIYALSGNTVGITPGERMSLRGKKAKSKGNSDTHLWVATSVTKDFGVCQF